MNLNLEGMFDFLIEFRKKIDAPLPDDKFHSHVEFEDDVMPSCFLIYNPDQKQARRKYHFMACSEIKNARNEGCLMTYRITNNISGLFRMYDGSLERLSTCESCLTEYGRTKSDFNIREFFSKGFFEFFKKHEDELEELYDILRQIWMGASAEDYRNETGRYPKHWQDIISPIYRKLSGKCEICGNEKNLDVHHINMYKPDTRSDNLIVLCKPCHTTIHRAIDNIIAGRKPTDRGQEALSKYNLIIENRRK